MVLMNPPKKKIDKTKGLFGLVLDEKFPKAAKKQNDPEKRFAQRLFDVAVQFDHSPAEVVETLEGVVSAAKQVIDTPDAPKKPYIEKTKFIPHEVHGRLWLARNGTQNQDFSEDMQREEYMVRLNPPITEDLLQSAPIAVTNAALVTALSSYCETKLKAQFATSAKPELYAKLSGAAIGAAVTAAGYLGAKYLIEEKREDEEERNKGTYSTPILVGGAVALGIRLLAAFVPNWFANPALPQATVVATTPVVTATTAPVAVGDYLNVSNIPSRLPNRMIAARPATQRALSDYVSVPQAQAAVANRTVALRSPFGSTPLVRN